MTDVHRGTTGPRVTETPFDHEDAVRLRAVGRIEMNAAVGYASDHAPTLTADLVRAHFLVRDGSGAASACGALVDAPDGVLELRGLYVRRDVRDDMIAGSALLDAVEVRAQELGAPAIVWECAPQMELPISRMTGRGYARIANFGPYVGHADSACFAKVLV